MKKRILYILVVMLCVFGLMACGEEETEEKQTLSNASDLQDKYGNKGSYKDDEDESGEDESDEDESEEESSEKETDDEKESKDENYYDNLDDELSGNSGSGSSNNNSNNNNSNSDMTGYESYGRLYYKLFGYSFIKEEDDTKTYTNSAQSEVLGVTCQDVKGVNKADFIQTLEFLYVEMYGEWAGKTTYTSDNGYVFNVYSYNGNNKFQGTGNAEIYVCVENNCAVVIMSCNTGGTLSNNIKNVVNSAIIK